MKKHLKSLAEWSNIAGILGLFIGAISALLGYAIFYLGAIPGLLIVLFNIRLLRASRSTKRLNYNLRLIQNDMTIYDETLKIFTSYFRIQVITFILIGLQVVSLIFIHFYFNVDILHLIYKEFIRIFPFI